MRVSALALVLLVSFLFFEHAKADKKYRRDYHEESDDSELNYKTKPYKKYDGRRKPSDEYHEKESRRERWDSDDSSEEDVIKYRRKKEDYQKKRTLGDIFQEKKLKKEAKKEKFRKNVLKHFKNDDSDEIESSEEIIAPLRKIRLDIDCNSLEEECE